MFYIQVVEMVVRLGESKMLSWDEFDKEDLIEVKVVFVVVQVVVQGYDKLDDEVVGLVEEVCVVFVDDFDVVVCVKKVLNDFDIQEGLDDFEGFVVCVQVGDKQMINVCVDFNQFVFFKYDWVWQKYLDGCVNYWMLQEVNMNVDIVLWKSKDGFSEDEWCIVMCNFGFFFIVDLLVVNNLVLVVYCLIINFECCQYILCQVFEEVIYIYVYQYCIELLGMDEGEIFNMYYEIFSVVKKVLWGLKYICLIFDLMFQIGILEIDCQFLCNLIVYYCVLEGIFFYCGFIQIFFMGCCNKMIGIVEQFQYIFCDELMYLNFGIDVINQIKIENLYLWDVQMKDEVIQMIFQGIQLEIEYVCDIMLCGVLGMNVVMMEDYLKFIVNWCLIQIGLKEEYLGIINLFLWMLEIMDLKKEKNFFEMWVIEYQMGGVLSWD